MVIDNENRQQALQRPFYRGVVITRTGRQGACRDRQLLNVRLIRHYAIDALAVALAGTVPAQATRARGERMTFQLKCELL
jgi:hypothetical protein